MPHKGMFTQGVAVLFRKCPALQDIEAAPSGFTIRKRTVGSREWSFGGSGLVLDFRPDVNGYVSVDICDRPWPDSMGDTKTDTTIFGAWSLGYFGPFAYPGNLRRAAEQAWLWPAAREVIGQHDSFVRVRTSYVFGAREDMLVQPPDYEPVAELAHVTKVARALLDVPEALAYFNPNGECLASAAEMDDCLERFLQGGPMPQELWSNVRLFNLNGHAPWVVMDSVGMAQLDVPDQEACCDGDAFELSEVASFLRNAADYVHRNEDVIQDGDTMDGPGGIRWQGAHFENGLLEPPRRVVRWFPLDGRERPPGVQGEIDPAGS